ncbi:hypothetical protein ACLSU7_06925 [Bdellovibrio sp. HCB185ZH]|uniref:hypothetical protein n=1 Tax=Bdellovibrio sp. HCB185ZH TaxID=3394235 RepID=UPI0039A59085
MLMTKEGSGNYASLNLNKDDDPNATRAQRDLICDFWCGDCENRFRDDDANGARFFKDRRYIKKVIDPHPSSGNRGIEIHDGNSLNDLRSFIVSLLLRGEVYGRQKFGKKILGSRFNYFAKSHVEGVFSGNGTGLLLVRNSILSASHSSPVKTRFGDRICVMLFFCGYNIFLVSDSRGPEDNDLFKLASEAEIIIPIFGAAELPHLSKLIQAIQKIGSLSRRKEK